MTKENEDSTLVSAAKAIGSVAGKVAHMVGATGSESASPAAEPKKKGKLPPKNKERAPRKVKKLAKKKAVAAKKA